MMLIGDSLGMQGVPLFSVELGIAVSVFALGIAGIGLHLLIL